MQDFQDNEKIHLKKSWIVSHFDFISVRDITFCSTFSLDILLCFRKYHKISNIGHFENVCSQKLITSLGDILIKGDMLETYS